jgi:flavin-dependent dehydrogenase
LISQFKLSSTGKQEFETTLDLGGFGISRFVLEELLYEEAKNNGVVFMLNCKAFDTYYHEREEDYTVKTNNGNVSANLVCNSSGRKSNLETKEKATQITGTNYIGIKYHVKLERDPSFVEIHNFPGGYCGLSGIEDGKTCLCYIVNSKNLTAVKNSIPELERVFLFQNPHLKKLFGQSEFLYKEPLTISGINFIIKEQANDNALFLGDSAGCIAPITGNGMSIALRSAFVLANSIDNYFSKEITKRQLIDNYRIFWHKEFSTRLKLSRHLQKLSEYPILTNLCIGIFKPFPGLAKSLMKHTHGKPF